MKIYKITLTAGNYLTYQWHFKSGSKAIKFFSQLERLIFDFRNSGSGISTTLCNLDCSMTIHDLIKDPDVALENAEEILKVLKC
jgi:hypothetical protein